MSKPSEKFQQISKHISKVEAKDPAALGYLTLDDIDRRSQELVEEEVKALEAWRSTTCHGPDRLMGLALSGGGIRSATFSLGVMQALARYQILKKIDDLSMGSGGECIGSSLSWRLKEKAGAGKRLATASDDSTARIWRDVSFRRRKPASGGDRVTRP